MAEQNILTASKNYTELDQYFHGHSVRHILLVCGSSISSLRIGEYFRSLYTRLGIEVTFFSNFNPNPSYESVVEGVELFRKKDCDMIVAVGGGSAMDVAKCIKLFSTLDPGVNYLKQLIIPNDINLMAIPTTAGTGSEATRYAVIYFNGDKQSITHESCVPSTVLMDTSALKTLPLFQKKATMMDALCHALESFWSINSTSESQAYSAYALRTITENYEKYLANDDIGNSIMLKAANIAGKAINITQTTAGHAMSYKITSLYGIPHGQAVSMCILKLWPFMQKHAELCIDPRGAEYLSNIFCKIAEAMGCADIEDAIEKYSQIYYSLDFKVPSSKAEDYDVLRKSVNPVRLKNHPVLLTEASIDELYHQILK